MAVLSIAVALAIFCPTYSLCGLISRPAGQPMARRPTVTAIRPYVKSIEKRYMYTGRK